MSVLDTLTNVELDQLGHAVSCLMVNLQPDLRVTDVLTPIQLHLMCRVFRWLDSPETPSQGEDGTEAAP